MVVGLFSRRERAPYVHEPVARAVYVRAGATAVIDQVRRYGELASSKHSVDIVCWVGVSGGWTAVRLPNQAHPWLLHNLAFWLLDIDGQPSVIAHSGPSSSHGGYALVVDPDLGDAMCGLGDDGEPWTVSVPTNDVVRGDPVPVSAGPLPSGFDGWQQVTIAVDDPGGEMNPRNEPTVRDRARLRRTNPWDGV